MKKDYLQREYNENMGKFMSTRTVIIVIGIIGFFLFFQTEEGKRIVNEAINEKYNECIESGYYKQEYCAAQHYMYGNEQYKSQFLM